MNCKVYRDGVLVAFGLTSPSFRDTGLVNGVQHSYQVTNSNSVGESPKSSAVLVTPVDLAGPIISGITQTVTGETTATISWSLSEGGTGQVEYGTTTGYGLTTILEPSYLTAHTQDIIGLTAGTIYHYRIRSVDVDGNPAVSTDRSFTTLATPAPGLVIAQFPGAGANTAAAFMALMANMSYDVIEIAAGTYSAWHLFVPAIDRTARPLLIRPAAGAAVIWDGADGIVPGGSVSSGLFYFGTNGDGKTAYITFDPTGTGGSFRIQNYRIADTGIIATAWVDHFTMNGFVVRNCNATVGLSTYLAHTVYVSSDGVHRGADITFNDWDVISGDGVISADLQISHTPGPDRVTAMRWKTNGGRFGCTIGFDPTGVLIDGWTMNNHISPFNATPFGVAGPHGIVRNVHATNCGTPLFDGVYMVDGGGNVWSSGGATTCTVTVAAGGSIQAAINAAVSGSIVCLVPGATYTLTQSLLFSNKSGITLDGKGATIQTNLGLGSVFAGTDELIFVQGGSNITFKNFILIGSHANPGVYPPGASEFQAGIAFVGTQTGLVDGVTIRNNMGDGVGIYTLAGTPARNIEVKNCNFTGQGRWGVTATHAEHVWAHHNTLSNMQIAFECEADGASPAHYVSDFVAEDNTLSGHLVKLFGGYGPGDLIDVVIRRNTVAASSSNEGIHSYCQPTGGKRSTRFVFVDNVGSQPLNADPGWRAVVLLCHADNPTITGNTQPISGSGFVGVLSNDSTGITVSGNTFTGQTAATGTVGSCP